MSDSISPAKKILIIDDDNDVSGMMTKALAMNGYHIVRAETGEHGLELFKREHPDLVLLDVALPGINGFEVATDIRSLEPVDKHTVIIIITAYSQSFLVSSEFQTGIDSYMTKPVVINDLLEQVSQLLEN